MIGSSPAERRVALVHYWLVRQRGGENVLQAMLEALGRCDLFTNVHDPDFRPDWLKDRDIRTTFLNKFPWARKIYPMLLPMMPAALGALDMQDYDLVISSEAGPAKWIVPAPEARHICYMHSPMRYVWDQMPIYMDGLIAPMRFLSYLMAERMRASDVISAQRVDMFVANSTFVAKRIERYYRRDARVIHPPVDVPETPSFEEPEDFYLCAGQLVAYKRVDLAIRACRKLGRKLIVVGQGSAMKRLRDLAGDGIELRGFVSAEELRSLSRRCRALLYPGIEDFGITPVEVMGDGRPVIAFGRGGALDYVEHGKTGVLYRDDSVEGLMGAIQAFEEMERSFSPEAIHAAALRFRPDRFRNEFLSLVEEVMAA